MFELKISTDNAAFHDDAGGVPDKMAKLGEVRRILRLVSERIEAGETAGKCIDYNGNVVGFWKFTEVKVHVRTNTRKEIHVVSDDATPRQILDTIGVDYRDSNIIMDGAMLIRKDFDKPFSQLGVSDQTYLDCQVRPKGEDYGK